jgi:hypothetical protein
MTATMYLENILNKYAARSLDSYLLNINSLKTDLKNWASTCYIATINSGSRAKGTAISLASDVDYLISLTSNCNANNGGLKSIYDSLYTFLKTNYSPVRKQNVSFRIKIGILEVDITPARKHSGNTNDHWIYVSKLDTWRQTNIQKHITDISNSGRQNEIKLLKIWRELNGLDFPSIYLEYLTINTLSGKSKDATKLADNFLFVLQELSKDTGNPLNSRIVDTANSTNILSDLLNVTEKNVIITKAKTAAGQKNWSGIVW